MKKKAKKLTLAKETVRNLDLERSHVAGGSYVSCITACDTCYCSASCGWTCACNSNQVACIEPQTREC